MILLENVAFPFRANRHELSHLDPFQDCAVLYCEGLRALLFHASVWIEAVVPLQWKWKVNLKDRT